MRIVPGQTIAGRSASDLKAVIRLAYPNDYFETPRVAAELMLAEPAVSRYLMALEAEGYLSFLDTRANVDRWEPTRLGRRLAATPIRHAIPRARAEKALAAAIAAAREVNADPQYAYDVTRIVVFGSYLTDAAEVGDVDISFDLVQRPDPEVFEAAVARCPRRTVLNYFYPRKEVEQKIRRANRYLSIYPFTDIDADRPPVGEVGARIRSRALSLRLRKPHAGHRPTATGGMNIHCGDCRFWRQPATQCRRNAPLPNGSKQGSASDTAWPHVAAEDWCGEYQPGYIDRISSMPAEAQHQASP